MPKANTIKRLGLQKEFDEWRKHTKSLYTFDNIKPGSTRIQIVKGVYKGATGRVLGTNPRRNDALVYDVKIELPSHTQILTLEKSHFPEWVKILEL